MRTWYFSPAEGGGVVTYSFTDHKVSATNEAEHTFANVAIGTAAADRIVLIGISTVGAAAPVITPVTIGGISASQVAHVTTSTGTTDFWHAVVPTGTTANIVVTGDNSPARWGIQVWAIYGASTTVYNTATDFEASGTTLSAAINTIVDGAVFGVAQIKDTNTDMGWTELTEETGSEEIIEDANNHSGASKLTTETAAGVTVTVVGNGSSTDFLLLALASYQPS